MVGVRQWLREGSALAGADLDTVEVLRDGEASGARNDVRRVGDGERTWMMKAYLDPAGNPVAREVAGLLVAGADLAPRVIGVATDPPVLLMEDLGAGPALSDLLRTPPSSTSPSMTATEAITGWADTLGRLHQRSAGRRADFVAVLDRHGGCGTAYDGRVEPPEVHDELVQAVGDLQHLTAELDLPSSEVLAEQVRVLLEPLTDPGDAVLSPGDACPENNRLLPGSSGGGGAGVVLLDFEFAAFRHPAWDVAYLYVPWPTCWSSWRIPEEASAAARRAYAQRLGPDSWLGRNDAADLLERAVLGWCLASSAWFLREALEVDAPAVGPEGEPTPGRRSLLLHRLARAASTRSEEAARVAAYAGVLHAELVHRWGERPLPLAPACT